MGIILTLDRFRTKDRSTLGYMTLHDSRLDWFTLEDGPSPAADGSKVPGETRIPAGTYALSLVASNMAEDRRKRWPAWHTLGIIRLVSVDGFQYINFHDGESIEHTRGCVLVASSARIMPPYRPARLAESERGYEMFYRAVAGRLASGEPGRVIIGERVGP